MQQAYDAYPKDILEGIHKIEKYQQQRIHADEPGIVHGASVFIIPKATLLDLVSTYAPQGIRVCALQRRNSGRLHLRLIINSPQRPQRMQSKAVTLWYKKVTAWRNRTRMTRIARIFTDTESVCIRVICAICVLSRLLWNFVPFVVKFLQFTYQRAPFMEA